MLQTGNRPRFKLKTLNEFLIQSGMRRQDFYGDESVNVGLVGKIDGCHASTADD